MERSPAACDGAGRVGSLGGSGRKMVRLQVGRAGRAALRGGGRAGGRAGQGPARPLRSDSAAGGAPRPRPREPRRAAVAVAAAAQPQLLPPCRRPQRCLPGLPRALGPRAWCVLASRWPPPPAGPPGREAVSERSAFPASFPCPGPPGWRRGRVPGRPGIREPQPSGEHLLELNNIIESQAAAAGDPAAAASKS